MRTWPLGVATALCLGIAPLEHARAAGAPPAAEAQEAVRQGVVALHNFDYEDANEAFRRAQALAPDFVMGYWGEAMTYHQTLWRHENLDEARRVLARLASSPSARAEKATTPEERGYLAAVESLFGSGDDTARKRQYAESMRRLYASNPGDPDIAAFYALSLLGTMARSLIGHVDAQEGRSEGLAGSETQARVAEILGLVLQAHPRHPGALHYLIHDYDDAQHAHLALDAARVYATVAAESSHARHMPAHIFVQLGMWSDAAHSDRAAYESSLAWVARKGLGPALRSFHALSWLQYELLQLGRFAEAWSIVEEMGPLVEQSGQLGVLSSRASMRGRFVMESRRWRLLSSERDFANADELLAIGVSAARGGNVSLAELARQALVQRAEDPREGDLRPAIAVAEREVAALIALADGRRDRAVEILEAAARQELALPAPLGLPAPLKPAPELLGEVLVEIGRARDALPWFERALARNPNRSLSVLGRARAAMASGDRLAAHTHYAQLLSNYAHADEGLPELAEARSAIAGAEASPPVVEPGPQRDRLRTSLVAGGAVVAVALLVVVARSRRAVSGAPASTSGASSGSSRGERRRPAVVRRREKKGS